MTMTEPVAPPAAPLETGVTPPPPAGPPTPTGEPQTPQVDGDDVWADPVKAKAEIERLRREASSQRINAKKAAADEARAELLASIQKAIDPNAAGDPPSVDALTATLTAAQEAQQETARDLAIVREAWKQNLNPAKLDYLAFVLTRRSDLDSSAEDFADKLAAAITDEVAKDSSLKLSGAAVGTGAEQFGGAGTREAMTKAQFDALSVSERTDLYRSNRAEYDRLVSS